jgi:flavodoxin
MMKKLSVLALSGILIMLGQLFAATPAQTVVKQGTAALAQKKVLVVYYSRTGNTKRVASDIARVLNADIEQVVDKKDRSGLRGFLIAGKDSIRENLTEIEPVKYDPALYDLVVLGTPVWAGHMTPALRTYITATRTQLKQIAVFTTSGSTKPDKIVQKMESLAGKKAVSSIGFFSADFKEDNKVQYNEKLNSFIPLLK